MASFMPSLANSMMSRPAVRKALDRYVGIDARRKMPPIAQQTFESWFRKRKQTQRLADNRNVVLFHDTFINFNYPDVGKAATAVLEAAGYHVEIAERQCCGRPMISKGLPEEARENARSMSETAALCRGGILHRGLRAKLHSHISRRIPDLIQDTRSMP
jgi:Fe-S oxidoreductase